MPTVPVRAVGIALTASARRQPRGRHGHVYADGRPMPTAAVDIYRDMPTAFLCLRLP